MRSLPVVTILSLLPVCTPAHAVDLNPGDAAPEFALPGSDGAVHRLGDEKGKHAVVLAWFPKAFTGG
jgi:peroxiredoxin Q/BCP